MAAFIDIIFYVVLSSNIVLAPLPNTPERAPLGSVSLVLNRVRHTCYTVRLTTASYHAKQTKLKFCWKKFGITGSEFAPNRALDRQGKFLKSRQYYRWISSKMAMTPAILFQMAWHVFSDPNKSDFQSDKPRQSDKPGLSAEKQHCVWKTWVFSRKTGFSSLLGLSLAI